jgi:hypothetical protein
MGAAHRSGWKKDAMSIACTYPHRRLFINVHWTSRNGLRVSFSPHYREHLPDALMGQSEDWNRSLVQAWLSLFNALQLLFI